jgi:beta-lysine 5,6-aminomutase alpha subunit
VLALESATYVETAARDLADEIEFKPGGLIQTRAQEVLEQARILLEEVAEIGLSGAIEEGRFGDVRRASDEGRGAEGLVPVESSYFNPLVEVMSGVSVR